MVHYALVVTCFLTVVLVTVILTGAVGGNLSNTVMYSPGSGSALTSMTPMPGGCCCSTHSTAGGEL